VHFLSRKSLAIIGRLILATMLFAQYSLAAQACTLPEAAPAMAFSDDSMTGCSMDGNMDHDVNRNACLTHCTADYQTLDSHHPMLSMPPLVLSSPLLLPAEPDKPSFQAHLPSLLARVTGPPLSILHQKFLN